MERGGRFHRYRRHPKRSAASANSTGTHAPQPKNRTVNSNSNNTIAGSSSSSSNGGAPAGDPTDLQQQQQQEEENRQVPPRPAPCVVREQDQYMPIANVIRIMRRILPPHAKISDDAKETIQECVSEYISFITGEANDRCQKEQRKTITAEDVLWSMGKLGFDDYVEPLTIFLNRYRESESDRSSSRDAILKRTAVRAVDYRMNHLAMPMPPPHFNPSYPMLPSQPPPPMFPAPPQNVFDGGMMGGYFRDPTELAAAAAAANGNFGGAGNSPNQILPYDPFSQFK